MSIPFAKQLARRAPEELDDDAYFADLAAGAVAPASELPDPNERPGTAGRSAAEPATAPAPRQTMRPWRHRSKRPAAGRRWRPRRIHAVAAAVLVAVLAVIAAGSERRVTGPAGAADPANGTPAVGGAADLRLAWRGPSDRRPRELTLGGRLTVAPGRTPVVGARLDVLAGDQAG